MWTNINQVFTSNNAQNCWAHLAVDNKWHKVLTGAADGVTNAFLVLAAAKANGKQVYVVQDGSGNITQVYM
jgi:chloramphenicol 3-O-phosphotransferase